MSRPARIAESTQRLVGEIVRCFDREDVVGMLPDEPAKFPTKVEVAKGLAADTLLLPDKKERRAGAILPAHDRVPAQRPEIEIRIIHLNRVGRRRISIGIDRIDAASLADRAHIPSVDVEVERARRPELLEARKFSGGDERLQVDLEGRFGGESPVDASLQREGRLVQRRKYVPPAIGAGRQRIAGGGYELGEGVSLLQIGLEAG